MVIVVPAPKASMTFEAAGSLRTTYEVPFSSKPSTGSVIDSTSAPLMLRIDHARLDDGLGVESTVGDDEPPRASTRFSKPPRDVGRSTWVRIAKEHVLLPSRSADIVGVDAHPLAVAQLLVLPAARIGERRLAVQQLCASIHREPRRAVRAG